MSSIELQNRINALPENLRREVEDFVSYLLEKSRKDKMPKAKLRGSLKGKILMSEDFDQPLDDFKEYME